MSSTAVREAVEPTREPSSPAVLPDLVAAAAYEAASRLMESLLHDSRNPLNALAINLEVLAEKLKDDDGKIPETQEKNIRAMRDQIFRVDAILRQFADYMTPRLGARGELNLSEMVARAVEVVGHESRRRRVKLKSAVEPNLMVPSVDHGFVHLVLVQSLLRTITRTDAGAEASVVLDRHGNDAVVTLSDPAAANHEPLPQALEAIRALCTQHGVRCSVSGGTLQLTFSGRA